MSIAPWHRKALLLTGKLAFTTTCFWYALRQVNATELAGMLPTLDLPWLLFATLIVVLEIPVFGLRWLMVLDALAARPERLTYVAAIAVTAIFAFFSQVLPNLVGEGVRVWLLNRFGCDWRRGVTSVVIDRGVGVGVLITFAFVILLFPSALTALAGYRSLVLVVFGAAILSGIIALVVTPLIVPLLTRWRYLRLVGVFAADAHRVLFGPRGPAILAAACLIHALTIVIIWPLGRSQGLMLPLLDAAVLFTVMVGVALMPISVGGWGLREVAVISLLGAHGVAPERALLFSVSFGLVYVAGSLPGAMVWLLYPIPRVVAK
jgi:glycosyltransferase 2 family protein